MGVDGADIWPLINGYFNKDLNNIVDLKRI
jgi:hypothetical protein